MMNSDEKNKKDNSTQLYDTSDVEKKSRYVMDLYNNKNVKELYASSRDHNLRDIEIDFILKSISDNVQSDNANKLTILDIGCGNGYTDICLAKTFQADITAIDFSQKMIEGALYLKEKFINELKGTLTFQLGDIRTLKRNSGRYDCVISERCLLNLPNREIQHDVIRHVYDVLKNNGIYIMIEGSRDGLRRLNALRNKVGLPPIPDRDNDNFSSLKFGEEDIKQFLGQYFTIKKIQHFGMYYLISRIIHPLLVMPEQPRFDAKINDIAKQIVCNIEPDYNKIGHIVGFVLEKK